MNKINWFLKIYAPRQEYYIFMSEHPQAGDDIFKLLYLNVQ